MNQHQYYDKYKRDKKSKQFYHSSAWAKCRELALKRDNYLCQDCLSNKRIRKADMVHHVVEVRDDFTQALVLENLRSLCNSCHNRHHERGKKTKRVDYKIPVLEVNANQEQW